VESRRLKRQTTVSTWLLLRNARVSLEVDGAMVEEEEAAIQRVDGAGLDLGGVILGCQLKYSQLLFFGSGV